MHVAWRYSSGNIGRWFFEFNWIRSCCTTSRHIAVFVTKMSSSLVSVLSSMSAVNPWRGAYTFRYRDIRFHNCQFDIGNTFNLRPSGYKLSLPPSFFLLGLSIILQQSHITANSIHINTMPEASRVSDAELYALASRLNNLGNAYRPLILSSTEPMPQALARELVRLVAALENLHARMRNALQVDVNPKSALNVRTFSSFSGQRKRRRHLPSSLISSKQTQA